MSRIAVVVGSLLLGKPFSLRIVVAATFVLAGMGIVGTKKDAGIANRLND